MRPNGQQDRADRRSRHAAPLDQIEGQQEEHAGERSIEEQRQDVGDEEGARAEERGRQDRIGGPAFDAPEDREPDEPPRQAAGRPIRRLRFLPTARSGHRSGHRAKLRRATEPAQSSGPDGGRVAALLDTCANVSHSAAADSGRLIRKATRQLIVSIRNPPSGGPSEVVIADAAAQNPIARPRTSRGKVAAMIARLCGTSSAPPIPCTARPAIRIRHSAPARRRATPPRRSTMPITKIRLRPTRSPSPPATRISAPSISV